MGAKKIDVNDAKKLYTDLKKVDKKVWTNPDYSELFEQPEFKKRISGHNTSDVSTGLTLLGKMANQVSEKEFCDFLEKNKMPPMKLSAKEMELVRGGVLIMGIVGGILVVGLYIAYDMYKNSKPPQKPT